MGRGLGTVVGLALLASLTAPLSAEPDPSPAADWRFVDQQTGETTSVTQLRALAVAYPDSATVHRRLLAAQFAAGDLGRDATAEALVKRGFAFNDNGSEQIASGLRTTGQGIRFSGLNKANRNAVEASALVDTLPESALLVEGVARDPATGTLFASTVVSRQLFARPQGESWRALDLGKTGSLSGMVVDDKRGCIWVASGTFEETPGDPAYAAALCVDPVQGKVVKTLYANGAVPLGDIALGDDGQLFASNPLAGEIHSANPDSDQGFRALIGAGVFRSPQGMVKVPGRNRLIVSDYRYGLAAVDWDSGKVWRIGSPGTHWLDGIDALLRYGDSMIAIQNGHQPMRILKLDMREDWLAIEKITVLESNHPEWTEPVGASIDGDRLIYVATGQWDVFGKGGAVREGKQARPTAIRALPLPHD